MKTMFQTAVTLLLLSMSLTSYAAGDDKTYPGSFCQVKLEEDPDLETTKMVCPIVRDNTENKNGLQLALVRVFNNDDSITCTLQSESAGGQRLIAKKTASTDLPGVQTLNVTVKKSVRQGVYEITCELPCLAGGDPFCGSGIISYRILEHRAAEDLFIE